MTPFNFLLANQSLALQVGSPNKKARHQFIRLSFRVIKTIPKIFSPDSTTRLERQQCTTEKLKLMDFDAKGIPKQAAFARSITGNSRPFRPDIPVCKAI